MNNFIFDLEVINDLNILNFKEKIYFEKYNEAKIILDKVKDINIKGENGETFLHIMCNLQNVVDIDIHLFEYILQKGANVNIQNEYGETPLIYAHSNLKTLSLLLKVKDINLNIKNNNGKDVLMLTSDYFSNIECLKLLLNDWRLEIDPSYSYIPCRKYVKNEILRRRNILWKLFYIARKEGSMLGSLPKEIFNDILNICFKKLIKF